MDVDSARYLISALIQATVISWALVVAMHIFLYEIYKEARASFRQWFLYLEQTRLMDHLVGTVGKTAEEITKDSKKALRTARRTQIRFLKLVGVLTLVTVVLGIIALASFGEDTEIGLTVSGILVFATAVFSVATFLFLAYVVWYTLGSPIEITGEEN